MDCQYKALLTQLGQAERHPGPETMPGLRAFVRECCARSVQLADTEQFEMASAVLVRAEEVTRVLRQVTSPALPTHVELQREAA
jgi:hypothetical protein